MEPRARAGKNVGKMNFSYQESHGDSRQPLQETMKVIDEILTEFIQGVSFEAARVAQLSGRQKVKYEDFQFAMRKNPMYLGKAAENKELREALDKQRKMFDEDEYTKDDPAASATTSNRGRKRKAPGGSATEHANEEGSNKKSGSVGVDEEELGDADDEDLDQLVAPTNRRA
ncbi:hypothetical protein N0V82_000808 [Gnomoniopsis sp. IMI 355080]|nr:hypothetical protein N0V82_000808 [Gnomoniopsis sp. IMI 355080]